MTTTNYLSPEDFKKMVDAIPLVTEYNKGRLLGYKKNTVPNPQLIQAAFWVQYCCAMRITEVLTLKKTDFNFDRKILTLTNTKTGYKIIKGKKIRKPQFTSIPPDFPGWVKSIIIQSKDGKIFPLTRGMMWSYIKKACKFAGLDIGEQQDYHYIDGAWTHLVRKSRAVLMDDLGAKEPMIKVKLRHSFTVTDRYRKPDINKLIKWESENL